MQGLDGTSAGGAIVGAGIKSPRDVLGYTPGDARKLPSWPEVVGYFRHLGEASDRVRFDELGPATEGQPFVMATIAAPETLADLERYRDIGRRLADPRITSEAEAEELIRAGKTVVLLTCSIHSTEVGSTLMALNLAHELATGDDDWTREILEGVILLLVPSLNPDGWQLVHDWYGRTLGTPHEGTAPPTLYHTYTGHDNNRDWFMFTQVETRHAIEGIHNRWHPQIVFDQHQMMPDGARFFVPPYIDPYDPNVDPILQEQINQLGFAMVADLTAAGKRGVATSIIFDAYSPSRAYQHYHGGVRILSEAASCKICTPITLTAEQLREARGFNPRLATANHPLPWPGGEWTVADIVEYERIATRALLTNAARYRDRWLRGFYLVGRHAVERANPYAFVVPAGGERGRDPALTVELLRTLQTGGVEVERATAPFTADGVRYEAGDWVIRLAQPYGPFAKTLLEIQRYPDLRLYPGGPPKPPYDITAQTLGLQFGVATVQIEHPFEAALVPEATPVPLPPARLVAPAPAPPASQSRGERTEGASVAPPRIGGRGGASVVLIGAETNGSARAVNRLLAEGARVSRLPGLTEVDGQQFEPGAFLIEGVAEDLLERLAHEEALRLALLPEGGGSGAAVPGPRPLRRPRIGLYRSYRPNAMDEGWTRFILERFGFAPVTVRDGEVRQGRLAERFDCLVLAHQTARDILEGNSATDYPPEYSGGIGEVGAAGLRRFVEDGGTLVALDAATDLAIKQLYLPVTNALEGIGSEQFYAPGALFRIIVDPAHPLGWGFERDVAALYLNGPAFEVRDAVNGGAAREVPRVVAHYPLSNPLLSGWVLGPQYITGKAALVDVPVGRGRAILFGFRPQFRAQMRGTYRLLFNALYASAME
ncbi:MAG: M14 family metallopeptidase [Chloroflexota bacterium]|nr:M14 family metallopeptidase [Chloroflexota bacterium]